MFQPLIGQKAAVELLQQAVNKDRLAPAYLFVGPNGIGKSLAAECFIELVFNKYKKSQKNIDPALLKGKIKQRNHADLFWVEPTYLHQNKLLSAKEAEEAGVKRKTPPQIRLEQIREISNFLSRPPLEIERSIVVIEQADSMAESPANGLLKTLEEPGRATLILLAPSIDSLLPTLVSRCQRIPFYRLAESDMRQVLTVTDQAEILHHKEVLAMAQGSPGDAIACWQQLQNISPDLLKSVTHDIKNTKIALMIAKEIHQNLDNEAQLWLIDYLQHHYWLKQQKKGHNYQLVLKELEKSRKYLLRFVQPRLVWECALMTIAQSS